MTGPACLRFDFSRRRNGLAESQHGYAFERRRQWSARSYLYLESRLRPVTTQVECAYLRVSGEQAASLSRPKWILWLSLKKSFIRSASDSLGEPHASHSDVHPRADSTCSCCWRYGVHWPGGDVCQCKSRNCQASFQRNEPDVSSNAPLSSYVTSAVSSQGISNSSSPRYMNTEVVIDRQPCNPSRLTSRLGPACCCSSAARSCCSRR